MKKFLILAGILIGIIIVAQVNSKLTSNRDTDISEKEDIQKIFQELQKDQNQLKGQLEELRKEENEKLKFISKDIQENLEQSQKKAGFTKITGEGLIFKITNKNTSTQELASSLRDIVNLLLSLKAEAISINGYRVVFKTPIISVGDSILLKNFHITQPFEIKIIGNSDFILSAFEVKEYIKSFRAKVQNGDIELEVRKTDNLEIPAYIY